MANGAVSVGGSSSAWVSLGANYDFLDDQQTGDPASDILGNAANPGFFTTFDNAGTPSLTDGSLGFRVRLDDHGGNNNNVSFGRNLWLGIDADSNGSVDVFLGLNMQGSANEIGIFAPGSGANTSPSTTSVAGSPVYRYAPAASNYNYRPVDFTTDGGTTNDLSAGGNKAAPDYYVSFLVPFSDVVAFLNTKSISINQNSPLQYVVATSTQSNSFNQDLGGVNGGVNSSSTWTALGGFSPMISASSPSIPECSPSLLVVLGAVASFGFRRRR